MTFETVEEACELAHEKTMKRCVLLGIEETEIEDQNGDIRYPDRVQDIFNQYYEDITDPYGIENDQFIRMSKPQ